MKVLQITTNYPTESNPIFGIFMKEQIESLEQFGVKNTVFFSNGSESGVNKYHGGMAVHRKSAIKLAFHLLTHHYDLIHCHSVISGLILFCSGGAFFNKCVLSLQNDPSKGSDKRFFKLLNPFFNKIIVKTSEMPSGKIVYLPNGCNMEIFRPMDKDECKKRLGLSLDKRYVLFVDSNSAKKRTQKRKDRFDETMRILKDKYGYSDLEELVMVNVKREDVPTYINASDIHLLSSDLEGSPNSVKECMCCNVPVVATPVGNVRDLFEDVDMCKAATTFEAKELAKLVNEILSASNTVHTRESIKRKGLDMDAVARKLYRLYKEITNKE